MIGHTHTVTSSNYVGLAIMGGVALVIGVACLIEIWFRRKR